MTPCSWCSAKERLESTLQQNNSLIKEANDLREELRLSKRQSTRESAHIDRLTLKISQAKEEQLRQIAEWKTRCLKAEEESTSSKDYLLARERELDALRDRIAGAINDAEGEVRVSRSEAEALRERCIALEEQNEGLMARYAEAERIIRREGERFDNTMNKLVEETRKGDERGREYLEERHLLNKQWEKREGEILGGVRREARRVELKEEQIEELKGEIRELKRELSTGKSSSSPSPAAKKKVTDYPTIPSEVAREREVLESENRALKEEVALLRSSGKAADALRTRRKAREIFGKFKEGGDETGKMVREVRDVVRESGELLRVIQEFEKSGEKVGDTAEDSVSTSAFMSPYLRTEN